MDPLAPSTNFHSLSLKDLLDARDTYHWHLMNKANVIGTAVGGYLIRDAEHKPEAKQDPRTFDNARVRDTSWPCVLVLVRNWVEASGFGGDGGRFAPQDMVPKMLFMPDGRMVPVCVVQVSPAEAQASAPADIRWPASYTGGGFPLVVEAQGERRVASVGCLVTDGHTVYALTNRHVCGRPGTPISVPTRNGDRVIGQASKLQMARQPFTDVYPEFPGRRTYSTLDVGLVEIDDVGDWTSQIFGLEGTVGPIADLNETTLGLQLIDQKVTAFGAHSGALHGRIKALFYRHKTLGGHDYVSDLLIAPESGGASTGPGDSGTVWHLPIAPPHSKQTVLRPLAVEWGGQALAGAGGKRLNFALATNLAKACDLLDVDLVLEHNDGATPFWGQVGHYSIATAAIDAVADRALAALLEANKERISFAPDQLSADEIHARLANGDFVELADVPDLVWKKVANRVPGGRDVTTNTGPEHPTHYADIDRPGPDGRTLRELCLADKSQLSVTAWQAFYNGIGEKDARHCGLLPLRVWQFFDAIVAALQAGDIARAVCAMGVVSHYVGDACQPLHGSMLSDGYKDRAEPGAKTWPGRGVHSTYEDKMVDRFSAPLLAAIGPAAKTGAGGAIPAIANGQDAAYATVVLMDFSARTIPPAEICDRYIALGGGTSRPVVQGLWDSFGERTATLMGAGANLLAAVWSAALAVSGVTLPAPEAFSEAALAAIYQDPDFVPSLTLDQIGPTLSATDAAPVHGRAKLHAP
nr:hypothetical protein [uncultured Rhodopila sp.]